jgi:hypothetical protein
MRPRKSSQDNQGSIAKLRMRVRLVGRSVQTDEGPLHFRLNRYLFHTPGRMRWYASAPPSLR